MRKHLVQIACLVVTASSVIAQQNVPCPDYTTDIGRIYSQDVLSVRDVRLCLDTHETLPEPTARPIRRRTTEAVRQELELGIAATLKRLNTEALNHFVEAVRMEPYDWDAAAHLGSALVRMHQPSQALEFLLRAIMIDPRESGTHVNMAWAMLFLGKPAMAEAYARRAMALTPDSEPANYVLAWALILQSRHSDDLSRALSIAVKRLPDASNLEAVLDDEH